MKKEGCYRIRSVQGRQVEFRNLFAGMGVINKQPFN